MDMTTKTKTAIKATARTTRPKSPAARRRAIWRSIGNFLTSRSRDLAITAIVLGAFVAVFDGSLYSAKAFAFTGASAIAFAIMPDALMVLSAAKMRQLHITAVQRAAARRAMHVSLAFSMLTNMVAAFLRYAPAQLITKEMLLVGAIVYHGMIVIFLWLAVETLTKTRAEHKAKAPAARVSAPVTDAPLTLVNAAPAAPAAPSWRSFEHPVVATLTAL
jgi:hypothetical protein